MRIAAAVLVLLLASGLPASGAAAQDARFCPNRPDLGAGACTTEPGRVLVEMSAFDLEGDGDGDTLLIGDLLVRTGLGSATELQLGWTAFGRAAVQGGHVSGTGDVRIAVRQNLIDPTGQAFSLAVEPFVTLPVGRRPIGGDGATYGVTVPVGVPLSSDWDLAVTVEASAERDAGRTGRHLSLLGIAGLGYALSDKLGVVGELSVEHDDDPDDPSTQHIVAGSVAWQPRDRLQIDLLVAAGLDRDSPDLRVAVGGAVLF